MKESNRDKWLDEWVESAAIGQANLNADDWKPLNVWLLEPFFGDAWTRKWLDAIRKIEEERIPREAFRYSVVPSLWRKELRFLMWDAKIWGFDAAQRLKIAEFLRCVLAGIYDEDLFGLESNKPKAHPALLKIRGAELREVDAETAKQIGRLSASCPALAWSLFTDFYYANAYEMFGLYDASERFGTGASLLVKKFGRFKCPGLWRETAKFDFDEIVVGGVYENLRGHFDIINHFISNDSMAGKMKRAAVFVDGREVSEASKIKEASDEIAERAAEQFARLEALGFEDVKRKCVEAKWFQFKDFFAALGMDWRPPRSVFKRLHGRKLDYYDFPEMKTREEKLAFWRRVADPRIELGAREAGIKSKIGR